ncbi:uncharacterized protein LOC123316418 [Coccinella septempunctata]|uniref:uncharacterized protein LOC123316418 n=1 Tax=Coccinella septempunctata TaxID=41139 RepID=UPI001D07963D|nr:uncharacterized protein LOC123316418 [Coccinella septempunctata]
MFKTQNSINSGEMKESNMNPNNKTEEIAETPKTDREQPFFTKLLTEITSSFGKNHTASSKHRVFCFKENRPDDPFISSDIPSRVSEAKLEFSDRNEERKHLSEKYGRRSIVTQMYFENTSRNISLTSSDYLVPKFEHIDFSELRTKDPHQIALENSWKNFNALKLQRANEKIN